jgi:hypothetical protein
MQEIIIDEEFEFLLPSLDEETFRLLEESILEHGCRDPLVLWKGILIDGYNRFKICTYHGIKFNIVEMDFASREEVVIWIVTNQISRRNLTPTQLSHFRGLHYNADKELHGGNRRAAPKISKGQNDPLNISSTASRLSEQYNVSPKTIKRDAKLADGLNAIGEVSPELKRKILNGEVRIGKNRLEALAGAASNEIKDIVREIEDGTFVSRSSSSGDNRSNAGDGGGIVGGAQSGTQFSNDSILPEIKQLNTIISDFASSFNSALQELSSGESEPLKSTLRSFINELEELYQSL